MLKRAAFISFSIVKRFLLLFFLTDLGKKIQYYIFIYSNVRYCFAKCASTWRTWKEKISFSKLDIKQMLGVKWQTCTLCHTHWQIFFFNVYPKYHIITGRNQTFRKRGTGNLARDCSVHHAVCSNETGPVLWLLTGCNNISPDGWNTSGLMNRWPFYQGMPQCDLMEVHILQS